ncbi:MAG: CHC2 zinc finger domain-containing protein [Bacteroides sp.]|nr:CHC2 zinc finger domain-containing protein [Bacteroides sp.]
MNIVNLKQQNELGNTVERYLPLTWKGDRATGLCPFHDDKNPSLTVYRKKQRFICYACGAKGDVIDFIKQIEKCTTREAFEKLGGKTTTLDPPKKVEKPELLIRKPLPDHTRFLKTLMPYLPENRKLLAVYREFEVGLSLHLVPDPYKAQSNRIIFPIRDESGLLRGFSARSREMLVKTAKYIHTSSEQGLRTSELLCGLY